MRCNEQNDIQTPAAGQEQSAHSAGFRDLVLYLADRIGRQHIPAQDNAVDIHALLGADAVHHDLIKDTVRRIYRANRCGHLDADISRDETFVVLGEIRKQLASSQFTDIDQINLLESVGDACRLWFQGSRHGEAQSQTVTEDATAAMPETAKVIPLSSTG